MEPELETESKFLKSWSRSCTKTYLIRKTGFICLSEPWKKSTTAVDHWPKSKYRYLYFFRFPLYGELWIWRLDQKKTCMNFIWALKMNFNHRYGAAGFCLSLQSFDPCLVDCVRHELCLQLRVQSSQGSRLWQIFWARHTWPTPDQTLLPAHSGN
jgi:hypothetical protein